VGNKSVTKSKSQVNLCCEGVDSIDLKSSYRYSSPIKNTYYHPCTDNPDDDILDLLPVNRTKYST
jgi:hypothetical protein